MDSRRAIPIRPRTALLVGTDEVLLYTRKHILEKEGFRIAEVTPNDVIKELEIRTPDVVIACHTLSTEEAEVLVRAARSMVNPPALISFSKAPTPLSTSLPFDETVWSLATPESFISKVHEVLRSRSH